MMRTKIISTYGPAISEENVLKEVLLYADIIRFNFSHGTPEEKLAAKNQVLKLSREIGKDIALLADLPGPKIRVSKLENDLFIKTGDTITFSHLSNVKSGEVPIEVDIFDDMKLGCEISIGDGNPKLEIIGLKDRKIICKALQDGRIGSRKGINVKGIDMSAVPPTEEDLKLIEFVKQNDFDYIALSFVKSAENVNKARKVAGSVPLISKIERREAIADIKNIVSVSDGIMIARGDMALNIDFNEVPIVQDKIITECRKQGKPVIVATQMLESMTRNQSPTRAEITDVANAVKQGTDCVMLSDETAVGKYPIDTLKAMRSIILYTEAVSKISNNCALEFNDKHEGIAEAAAAITRMCKSESLFVPTITGKTAKKLSSFRPESEIISISNSEKLRRSLCIYYGIRGLNINEFSNEEEMTSKINSYAKEKSIKSYIIVFGNSSNNGTSDTIKCFWQKTT
ncbi:MAG: pyruvate kinase [Candidatus Micrarchaeia archaeon]